MSLKPDVQEYLDGIGDGAQFPADGDPAAVASWLRERRAAPKPDGPREPVGSEWEEEISDGSRVRVYLPREEGPHPLLVYFHGGGWVMGDLEMHDSTCRRLCSRARCSVVNVDYRLAPEHPFPAPLMDAAAAVQWAHDHADALHADPGRLAIAGSSSGGNLAAAIALQARDRGGPRIALQVLIYPVLDPDADSASHRENGSGYLVDRAQLQYFWNSYLSDPAELRNPYAAPAHAATFAGLPSALIVTAEYDPLRDEDEAYAARLEAEAVPTELLRYEGQIHGFLGMLGVIRDAEPALNDLADRIRSHLMRD